MPKSRGTICSQPDPQNMPLRSELFTSGPQTVTEGVIWPSPLNVFDTPDIGFFSASFHDASRVGANQLKKPGLLLIIVCVY